MREGQTRTNARLFCAEKIRAAAHQRRRNCTAASCFASTCWFACVAVWKGEVWLVAFSVPASQVALGGDARTTSTEQLRRMCSACLMRMPSISSSRASSSVERRGKQAREDWGIGGEKDSERRRPRAEGLRFLWAIG